VANYWLLSAGKDGELWPMFWLEGKIAVGWSALGDLRGFNTREDLTTAYDNTWPGQKPGTIRNNVTQLWNFYNGIEQGDLVFIRSYVSLLGIALVTGDYDFLGPEPEHPLRHKFYFPFFDDYFPHVRDVRWISLGGGMKQALTLTRLTVMERPAAPAPSDVEEGPPLKKE
jgi:predicted Mrr-cat superfamily restriction endonuclease